MKEPQTIEEIIQQQNKGLSTPRQSLPASEQKTMLLVSKYGDRNSFLNIFTPDYQRQICADTDACFFGDYPTLAVLKKAYGNNAPVMWLIPQLYNLSEYCGCKEKLQGWSLEECAYVIATEFYYLKISELMLFFNHFKAGRYGRFYGSVDPVVITTSLREFLCERAFAYERHEQEKRQKREADSCKKSTTWEEYCMKEYGKIKPSPLKIIRNGK